MPCLHPFAFYIGLACCVASVLALPKGFATYFKGSSCPSGWARVTQANGRLVVCTDNFNSPGGTVGTALGNQESRSHTHTASCSFSFGVHNIAGTYTCSGCDKAGKTGTYTSTTATSGGSVPAYPFAQLLLCSLSAAQLGPDSGRQPRLLRHDCVDVPKRLRQGDKLHWDASSSHPTAARPTHRTTASARRCPTSRTVSTRTRIRCDCFFQRSDTLPLSNVCGGGDQNADYSSTRSSSGTTSAASVGSAVHSAADVHSGFERAKDDAAERCAAVQHAAMPTRVGCGAPVERAPAGGSSEWRRRWCELGWQRDRCWHGRSRPRTPTPSQVCPSTSQPSSFF